jgi:hypothetical protein
MVTSFNGEPQAPWLQTRGTHSNAIACGSPLNDNRFDASKPKEQPMPRMIGLMVGISLFAAAPVHAQVTGGVMIVTGAEMH